MNKEHIENQFTEIYGEELSAGLFLKERKIKNEENEKVIEREYTIIDPEKGARKDKYKIVITEEEYTILSTDALAQKLIVKLSENILHRSYDYRLGVYRCSKIIVAKYAGIYLTGQYAIRLGVLESKFRKGKIESDKLAACIEELHSIESETQQKVAEAIRLKFPFDEVHSRENN